MYEGPVQDLIDELGRLPGIGPKSAQRLAFHILAADPDDVRRLADILKLHHCEGPSPPPRTPLSESFPTSRNANTVAADHQGPEVRLTGQRSCAHLRAAIARPGRSRHAPTLALRAPSS